MTTTPTTDDDRTLNAAPSWGGDTSPETEDTLEWIYTRIYNAWHNSDRINALDLDDLRALGKLRLDAHKHLSTDEHAELRAIETEIRRVMDGPGPDDVESTDELDVAWAGLLLDALEASEEFGQPENGGER